MGFPFGFGFPFDFDGGFDGNFGGLVGLAGTAPPLPSKVGAGRFGGGSGLCAGSKQSDMSSAVSSLGLMDGMPSKVPQNFNRLMWECCVRETNPLRA